MSSIDKDRKRTYQGVYLDITEDIKSDNSIARAADRAMLGVDAETVALYRKYKMLDKLPRRLQGSASDATWGSYNGARQASVATDDDTKQKNSALVREWTKRLANFR